jgi:YD repeat-containing protein
VPQYTAEPGMFGSLATTGDNCSGVLIHIGNIFECGISNAGQFYQATGYQYTDPNGRVYTIGATGTLQSLRDLSGNTLTLSAAGLSSSTGLNVPFVRDSQGRITQITDPQGHQYQYAYDASGNLASVTYPGITAPAQYQYDATHLLTQETDQRGNIAGSSIYYPDGRLKSVTDAVNNTTQYTYNTSTNTTTVTNPDGGTITTVADAYGKPLSVTDPLGRVTTNTYDANHNRLTMTDPLGKLTTYAYDSNGVRTSIKDPLDNRWTTVNNQFGAPTTVTDPLNQTQSLAYDGNFNVSTITDSLGQLAVATYNAQGLPLTLTDARGNTTSSAYDQYGNQISSTDTLNRTTTSVYDAVLAAQ